MLFSPTAEPQPLSTVFTFNSLPKPVLPALKFKRKPLARLSSKRSRPTADLDDALSAESKKKRRLRLTLITSRLSHPFSFPATHIVDPGSSKIAVWAKQRHLTQQVLRKAAIMNRVRRKTAESRKDSGISVGEDERRAAREACLLGAKVEDVVVAGLGPNAVAAIAALKREDSGYHSSSPLGLSNYDALDDEDDWHDGYHEEDEDSGNELPVWPWKEEPVPREEPKAKEYCTDWNLRDADEEDETYDPVFPENMPSELVSDRRPPSPPDGRVGELMKEREREQEIISSFLHFA